MTLLETATPQTLMGWIRERRSIRRYRPQPLPRELIERLIDAARYAPSAHNRQPWRFAILQDARPQGAAGRRHGRTAARRPRWPTATIRDAIERDVRRSYARITGAPVVIAVCCTLADMDVYPDARRGRRPSG